MAQRDGPAFDRIETMTNHELRAWIDARRLTIADAAQLLGLSKSGLHRQLSGNHMDSGRRVSRQTEIICELRAGLYPKPIVRILQQRQPPEEPRC